MSAISGYADLLVTTGEYAGRNDFAHLFPRFLRLAESKLDRRLRIGAMEKLATVTVTDGEGPLPLDFIEARSVVSPVGGVMRSLSIQALHKCRSFHSSFAVVGSSVVVKPSWSGDLEILYYSKIPPLTPAEPSNWLLELASEVYLFALVEEISIWSRDVDGASAAAELKDQAIHGVRINDERTRFSQNVVRIGGITP